jgi:hypothetical protein
MKLKSSIIISGVLFSIALSSCLKDKPFMDVSNTSPIIQFGLSISSGNPGPFAYAGDTAGSAAIDTAIALVLSSPQVLNDTIAVTIAVDPSQITSFNIANSTNFVALPDSVYTLPKTTVLIFPGYRVGNIPVDLNLPAFAIPHNYALALTIVNAMDLGNPNNLIIVSGNSGKFMWLFQQ